MHISITAEILAVAFVVLGILFLIWGLPKGYYSPKYVSGNLFFIPTFPGLWQCIVGVILVLFGLAVYLGAWLSRV